jgi:uncharacterized protein YukE
LSGICRQDLRMVMIGMDVDQVRALSTQLGAAAEEVQQVSAALTARLAATAWVGRDRDRFTQAWEGQHAPGLRLVAQVLEQAARSAGQSAHDQDGVSR